MKIDLILKICFNATDFYQIKMTLIETSALIKLTVKISCQIVVCKLAHNNYYSPTISIPPSMKPKLFAGDTMASAAGASSNISPQDT